MSPPGGGPELRWSVEGASDAPPEPEDPLPGVEHWFLGNDPSRWRTSVPRHASASYRQLRSGLDVKATPQSNGLTLTITATAHDGKGGSTSASLTLLLLPRNLPPTIRINADPFVIRAPVPR